MDFDHPPADPIALLNQWIDDAAQLGLPNPNAMSLATVDADGRPSCRTVLLKSIDARGAVFYTNRHSRKGRALHDRPVAAMLFHWDPLGRQVRIEGDVSLVSDAESDAYFATRPRASQIGAWASQQSQPVASRTALDEMVSKFEKQFEGKPVPRPPHWGGYRVSLNVMEFWQGHVFRLHDRIIYTPDPNHPGAWRTQRLQP